MPEQTERRGILAAGNFIVDHVKLVDDYPAQDQLALVQSHAQSNGGGPYNLLCDLAHLGAEFPLLAVGSIGEDPDGDWILRDCARRGIDTSALRVTSDAGTSWTDVMSVASTGRRTFFHYPGANAHLGLESLDLSRSAARIFYLGYLTMLPSLDAIDGEGRTAASRAFERACDAGLITAADLVSRRHARFGDIVASSAPYIDYLFLNELEAGWLLGRPLSASDLSFDGLLNAARDILDLGIRRGVVLHHEYGAVCAERDGTQRVQPAVRVPGDLIRSKLGAGDAFSAGFLHAVHEGEDTSGSLLRAVCAAATSILEPSASGGVRSVEECLAMAAEFGFHRGGAD
ncbi:MAG: carbohydrate kinase family protein [Pseudomonadota bacterium]